MRHSLGSTPFAAGCVAAALLLLLPFATPVAADDSGSAPELEVDPSRTIDLIYPAPVPTREIYRNLARAFGLEVVFDPNLRGSQLSIELPGADFYEALQAVELAAGHFTVPASHRTFVVAADTPQNRRAYEPLVIRTFSLAHADPRTVVTVLRSILSIKVLAINEELGVITLRSTPPHLDLAAELVALHDRPAAEVAVGVTLFAIDSEARDRLGSKESIRGRVSAPELARLRATNGVTVAADTVLNLLDGRDERLGVTEHFGLGSEEADRRMLKLSLDVKADVQSDRDVTLELHLEGFAQGKQTDRGSAREVTSTVTLTEGDAYVLAGLTVEHPDEEGEIIEVAVAVSADVTRGPALDPAEVQESWTGTESRLVKRAVRKAAEQERLKTKIRSRLEERKAAEEAAAKKDGPIRFH